MGKMSGVRTAVWLLALMMIGSVRVSSDFAQDKKECQPQLINLSSCIRFMSEDDKSPTPICCINLGENYNQKRRCLCMAIRDRNEPGLGIKVNATLALALPFRCHIQANVTQCIDFLHMDPQSPEAQIFKQSPDKIFGNNSAQTSTSSSSCTNRGTRWLNLGMVIGVPVWLFKSSLIDIM